MTLQPSASVAKTASSRPKRRANPSRQRVDRIALIVENLLQIGGIVDARRRRNRRANPSRHHKGDRVVLILENLLRISCAAIVACVVALVLLHIMAIYMQHISREFEPVRGNAPPPPLSRTHPRDAHFARRQTAPSPAFAPGEPCSTLPLRRGHCIADDGSGRAVSRHIVGGRTGALLPVHGWMGRLSPQMRHQMHVRERAAALLEERHRHNPNVLRLQTAAGIARLIDDIVRELVEEDAPSEDGNYGSHRLDPGVLASLHV